MSFYVGITAVLIVRIWFEKAIDDFNQSIIAQGKNGPELLAATGNGFTSAYRANRTQKFHQLMIHLSPFTVIWIAYAFYAAPLVASLAKINVAAGKSI